MRSEVSLRRLDSVLSDSLDAVCWRFGALSSILSVSSLLISGYAVNLSSPSSNWQKKKE